MIRELRLHPGARREFNDAVDYYERESPGLGLLFTDEVETAFVRIRENPGTAQHVAQHVRRLVLAKFPYSLIYETREGSVTILAAAHQCKRPYYLRGRR